MAPDVTRRTRRGKRMCVGVGGWWSQAALQGWQSVINFACVSPFLHLFCYFLKYKSLGRH